MVAVSAATTVTAAFAPVFTLTVSSVGASAGTVTSAPAGINCGATCSASFMSGTVVTLTATPSANWVFRGWSGGCTGSEGCVVTVSAATTVTATFAQVFALTVSTVGAGAGTVTSIPASISCGATCAASFVGGTVVTLTATPDGGSAFGGWNGGSCSGTGPCTLSLGAPTVVIATFNVTGPFTFTDPNLVGRVSTIKAVHIEELRSAINTARTNRGMDAFRFTDQNLMIERTTVEAVHIAELRAALDEVYAAVRVPAQPYTDPTLGVGTTVMKAVHIRELRSAVQTVPSFPE